MVESLNLDFAGEVSQNHEMLDGTRQLVLEGAARDETRRSWTLTLSLAWTMRAEAEIEESDLTLSRDDGSEVYASLSAGRYREGGLAGVEGAAEGFDIDFDIDSGAGEFDSVAGSVHMSGTVDEQRFTAVAEVRLLSR